MPRPTRTGPQEACWALVTVRGQRSPYAGSHSNPNGSRGPLLHTSVVVLPCSHCILLLGTCTSAPVTLVFCAGLLLLLHHR